jgi:tetratricopeptide (TPR) repeat protein
MKPVLLLPLGLLLLLGPVRARGEEEKPSVTAYRYGAMARADEMQGKNAEALEHFNRSLAIKPDPVIFSNRADLKKKLKDFSGAIADYDSAIALKPSDAFAGMGPEDVYVLYGNRGLLKHQLGDLDGAIADYSEVIRLHPNEAIYYNNRGYALITKGDRAGAIADYSKAAALEPKTVKFRENLANAKRDQGDYAGAIADYDKIVALDPKQPLAYYTRAALKQLNGNFAAAIKDYDKLIELIPNASAGFFSRGTARQAQGRLEAALADYNKAVATAKDVPEEAFLYREIVLRQLKRGTPDAEMSKSVANFKAGFYNEVGRYLSGAFPESDFLAKARQDDPKDGFERQCMSFYFVGMTKLLAGDKAAAAKFFEQSVGTKQLELAAFVLARSELARLTKPK